MRRGPAGALSRAPPGRSAGRTWSRAGARCRTAARRCRRIVQVSPSRNTDRKGPLAAAAGRKQCRRPPARPLAPSAVLPGGRGPPSARRARRGSRARAGRAAPTRAKPASRLSAALPPQCQPRRRSRSTGPAGGAGSPVRGGWHGAARPPIPCAEGSRWCSAARVVRSVRGGPSPCAPSQSAEDCPYCLLAWVTRSLRRRTRRVAGQGSLPVASPCRTGIMVRTALRTGWPRVYDGPRRALLRRRAPSRASARAPDC